MPTTTEVEARLRAAATACEPLVDALMADDGAPVASLADRRTTSDRGPRRGWLAAAAVVGLVALGAGAVVAIDRDDDRADEVATGPDAASDVGSSGAAPPGRGLLLPDGSRVEVVVPGPSEWEPDTSASVGLDLDGLPDPARVTFRAGTIADLVTEGFTIEQDLGEGRAVVREGNLTSVAVAHDGWIGLLLVATAYGGDEDLPAAAIDLLGRGLAFDVTPEGPIDVRAPGVTVTSGSRGLRPTDGSAGRIRVVRDGGNAIAGCEHTPPPWRCFAGDTVMVQVEGMTDTAETLVAGVSVDAVHGVDVPPTTEARRIALPTRDDIDLELPAGLGWGVVRVSARARVDGGETVQTATVTVTATPVAPGPARGPEVVDEGGTTQLLLERDGWRITLPLAVGGRDVVARDRWEPLRASLSIEVSRDVEMEGEGVTELVADGLTLLDATVELGPADGPADRLHLRVDGTDPEPCTPAPDTRCLMEGRVVAVGVGPVGLEVLSEARVQGMGSHS